MTFEKYQPLANRTLPDLGSRELNLCHMILGIGSELNELETALEKKDKINVGEELADIQWYIAGYLKFRENNMILFDMLFTDPASTPTSFEDSEQVFRFLYRVSSKLSDIVKKHIAYGKNISSADEFLYLISIQGAVFAITKFENIDIFKALENNIDKLKIRFPDKFDADKAINRDIVAERKELEKS